MINPSFRFCSWNAGASEDYYKLFKVQPDTAKKQELNEKCQKLYTSTALALAKNADVIALQEVEQGNSREEIQVLQKNGFEIIRPISKWGDTTDVAIAINPSKFKNIQNLSFKNKELGNDIAIVTAVNKETSEKIAFVSLHANGFDIELKNERELKDNALQGDSEVQALLESLKTLCHDCQSIMVGADMNAIIDKYAERFDFFKNVNFQVHRPKEPTNKTYLINGKPTTIPDRELDYFFVKNQKTENRFFNFLYKLFNRSSVTVTQEIVKPVEISLDPDHCPSDHIPIFIKHETEMVNSYVYTIFTSIKNFFLRK